ncbi:TonB-dependent receptor [Allosphingosinicella flava]|uniref:TonB-dependent receptor n=2 Tax=Allosphingosinicella flava TaxID=2771430 RepID=A0A7T2GM15_9SPHN|nr:TonB-dependent receptor [Sphingosinicella flava]
MRKSQIARLRTGVALSTIVLAGSLFATPALAQDASTSVTADIADTQDDQSAQNDIVVTGTIFRQSDPQTALPVTIVTAENLERAGITNVTDAIRSVSADGAGSIGNGFTSGFSAGGAAVSLRNLGVSSTLILVDGLRSTNFPLSDDGHNSYVDLNSIPLVNVEQVQVLKDGASSLYGADAIGGVVNIITRKQMVGLKAGGEAGVTQKGDGQKYRAHLLAGFGDYDAQGFNFYIGGDYEYGGRISANSRGFPFNTLDLSSIGGVDNNRADDTLTTATTDAIVTRVTQTDLNNPLAGSVTNATTPAIFTSLTPLANCQFGTYSENTASRVGTACRHDNTREYAQITPLQERYDFVARASLRLSDSVEGYLAGSYAHNRVDIISPPRAIRQTQAFGGAPATSTSNPGIVLPVYICSAGVNCATAADRRLNPNNPYAAAYANNPAAGAARIYYLFGDVRSGSTRNNEVFRFTGGLHGSFDDTWDWNVETGYSRANLDLTQYGWANLNGLIRAINTGSYNFVNPSLNTEEVRNSVAPPITARSNSSEFTVDATVSRSLFTLQGGDAKIAVGGQYRKEKLTNNSANPNLDVPGLSTAQAYGDRSVYAGFFEVELPLLDSLDVNVSGRYDHYSTDIGRFSPKATAKFQPIEQIAIRGSYSEGFRAPTFAEADPRSSYSGFVGFTPNAAFRAAHPNNSSYTTAYSLGRGYVGNPDIKPETARSFTLGAIFEPTPWLSLTADYFNVKKSNLIVTGPQTSDAINAYYSVANQTFASADAAAAAGCARVAAVGAGYSCNVVDGADPFSPNALPRLLVVNAPYVNANYLIISGLEFTADARVRLSDNLRWESRVDAQTTLKYNLHPETGAVQRYAGTVGPEDLSSGGGTPRWRANWQNTFVSGPFELSLTTYYVGRIKAVAADQASSVNGDISCAAAIYKAPDGSDKFCYVKSFIYSDLNMTYRVNDQFSFYGIVGNVTNARAPLFANTAYPSQVNTLTSWHAPGLIGRTFRAGVNFEF